MRLRHGLAPVLAAALFGCSLAPHYERPSTPQPPPGYKEAGDWKVSSPADTSARGHWWTAFRDPDLDALEAQVGTANQSLKAALASSACRDKSSEATSPEVACSLARALATVLRTRPNTSIS